MKKNIATTITDFLNESEYDKLPNFKMDLYSIIDYMKYGNWSLVSKKDGNYLLKKGDLKIKITKPNGFKASEYIYDNYKNRYEYKTINDENILRIIF